MSNEAEIIDTICRLLKLPDIHSVIPADEGADHRAFDVNGLFIARIRKQAYEDRVGAIEREAALLEFLSRVSPIPVPEVVALEPRAGLIVFRRLPGSSLFETPSSDPLAVAEQLAEFVGAIHGVPSHAVEHLVQRDEYPLSGYLTEVADQMSRIAACLSNGQRSRVELFLAEPVPPESGRRTLCHNDLGAEHILVSGDRFTGIIDWSDAALADPARDVGRVLRDFGFGVAEAVLRRTGGDETMLTRATFHARCALLEDIAYGIETSRSQYVTHALGRFAETFS
jgi:aminoglycoside phosphotransferase (APT) family kinase protein